MVVFEKKFLQHCHQENFFKHGDRILLGLSGGADSVAALHLLLAIKPILHLTVGAAHCNFMLRESASQDEFFCERLTSKYQVEFFKKSFDTKKEAQKNKLSIELAARELRYGFFCSILNEYHYQKIVVAHHADDNAETVLFNLLRGTSPLGFSGIPKKRGSIVRPLLCFKKRELVQYLDQKQACHVVDETNFDDTADRNFIRHRVLPLLEGKFENKVSSSLLRFSTSLAELQDYLESHIKEAIEKSQLGNHQYNVSILKTYPLLFQKEIFKEELRNLSVEVNEKNIERLVALLSQENGKKVVLSKNHVALRSSCSIAFKVSPSYLRA